MLLIGALLLFAVLAAPVAAQVPADRPAGTGDIRAPTGVVPDASVASLAPFAGRRVAAIDITGYNVTKDGVIAREIRTKVGEPLDLDAVGRDVARLDNLSIFSEIRVDAEPVGDDEVRLVFHFKEMPSWFPILSYVYTEENGLSWGVGVSAGNLTGRDLSVSARVYFGDLEQQWTRISWPWISGNHQSFDFYGARYTRPDELRGFEETSYEFTPEAGTWIGDHGWARAKFSYFRMKSDTAGITLSPDNEDNLLRLGASYGWDTRDSWRNPRRGWQNEVELWHTGGFLGGDGDWWLVNLDLRRWLPVTRRTKLMLSGLASLQSGVLGVDVPVYLDYYMGGANSIRGYGVSDLGTEFSGKNQMLGTAEYSFTVIPLRRWDLWKISLRLGAELAVFADVGIAWTESRDLTMRRTHGGLGSGLRLLVPGSEMVRLDVGWSPDFGFHFHFANGTKPKAQRARLR
ncbi:MAG: BamA/TamA family outer membrane protein [Burkholderiales bacterium]